MTQIRQDEVVLAVCEGEWTQFLTERDTYYMRLEGDFTDAIAIAIRDNAARYSEDGTALIFTYNGRTYVAVTDGMVEESMLEWHARQREKEAAMPRILRAMKRKREAAAEHERTLTEIGLIDQPVRPTERSAATYTTWKNGSAAQPKPVRPTHQRDDDDFRPLLRRIGKAQ